MKNAKGTALCKRHCVMQKALRYAIPLFHMSLRSLAIGDKQSDCENNSLLNKILIIIQYREM